MNMKIKLNSGYEIPAVGFGTWQTPDGEIARESVRIALVNGYRHIDTAAVYKNEKSVGEGIKASGIARDEIFLTTKLWNDKHSYEGAKEAIQTSLEKLDVDYLDLYLIHWPAPKALRDNNTWEQGNAEAWRAMEEAVESGLIRSIGVSNFMPHHLESLLKTAKIKPAVNQIYLSPSDQQRDVVAFNHKHGIVSEAYSPLGTGTILSDEKLNEIALKYGKSAAQVAIRWSLQKGFVVLPKSVTPHRIVENFDVFDFEINEDDMALIDTLESIGKTAPNPDETTY